jgi:hypothetical protein
MCDLCLVVVGEAALWKHRGLAHREFPSPEHSSIREGKPDEKALEHFFHDHNIQLEKQTTVNLLSLPVSLRQTKVRFSLDFVFTSREKLFILECNE